MARRILVIDDDEPIGDSIAEVLADEGYEVAVARNGQEGLAWLRDNPPPGLILLDLMMPVMDGYTFRRHQLDDPAIARIPTIAFSAGTVDARVEALGLRGWLRKPIGLDTLLQAAERWCRPVEPGPALVDCAARHGVVAPGHIVHYYRRPEDLAAAVVPFLVEALDRGEAAMVIVTDVNRVYIERGLAERGVDVAEHARTGRLPILDPTALLSRVLTDGTPDRARLEALARERLAALAAASPTGRFRVFGEAVNVLWQAGDLDSAVRLEALWNEICARDPFPLHCAYLIDADDENAAEAVRMIDREHEHRRIAGRA